MPVRPAFFIPAFVCLLAPARAPAQPVLAVFADGTQVTGEYVHDWYDHRKRPTLDGRWLFDPKNPVQLMRYAGRGPALSGPFVEFANGDVLPIRTVAYRAAEAESGMPARLAVSLEPPLGVWRQKANTTTVRADLVARIVWAAEPASELEPGLILFADGKRAKASAVKFVEDGITALTDAGTLTARFTELAELHLPNVARLQAALLDAMQPGPDDHGMVARVRLSNGAALTFRTDRMLVSRDDYAGKRFGEHGVDPLWALDTLAFSDRHVELRSFRQPRAIPLSAMPAQTLQQQSFTGFKWRWQRNRSVRGDQLTVGDLSADLGVGMHARHVVAFDLPDGAETFTSWVGLDRSTGDGGCVHLRVYRDEPGGKPLWEKRFVTGGHMPLRVGPVDIKDAGRLVLDVDFAHKERPKGADPADIRDQVNWLHPLVTVRADALPPTPDVVAWFIPHLRGWSVQPLGDEPLALGAMPVRGQWRTGTKISRDGLRLQRGVTVDFDAHFLQFALARQTRDAAHELELRVDGERRDAVYQNKWSGPGTPDQQQRALGVDLGETVNVEVVVRAASDVGDGRTSTLAWEAFGFGPLIRNLPPGGRPIEPDVPLTTLTPAAFDREEGSDTKLIANRTTRGEPIVFRGVTMTGGYGLGPHEAITYDLKPAYRRFVAVIGITSVASFDDAEIRIDGELVWRSRSYQSGTLPEQIDLEIPPGASTLQINRGHRGEALMGVVHAGFVK